MTQRTNTRSVTFKFPFKLEGFDEVLPAGSYTIETDEELLQGLSFEAYQRKSTVMRLPSKSGKANLSRALPIKPDDLEAALMLDKTGGHTPSTVPAIGGAGSQADYEKTLLKRRSILKSLRR